MKQFYTYILSSRSGVLYVGMTNDLERRMYEHKNKLVPGFTAKYNVNRLVYYEAFPDALSAIAAEKKLKGWIRARKIALIESRNPTWRDLSEDFEESPVQWRHAERSEASTLPSLPPSRDPSLRSG